MAALRYHKAHVAVAGGSLTIELPWPEAALSPNARGSHWPRTRALKLAREGAFWATRSAMGRTFGPTVTKLSHDGKSDVLLRQIAHPPDKRERDRDGIDARLKGHRDGIADALGINDKFFRPTGIEWGEVVRGGKIIIAVEYAGGA